jgi:hypothetical protein
MKSIKYIIIAIMAITIVSIFNNCSDNFLEEEEAPRLDIPEEFDDVGKLHNEGLEFIFEEIKAEAIEYTKNPKLKGYVFMADYDGFVKQATLKFCKQNKKLSKNLDVCEYAIAKLPSNNVLLKSETTDYPPAVQALLDEAHVVLSKDFKEEELSQLKTQLDVINKKAAETLFETDAAVIFCAISTGYHSYQYWMQNHRKWYFALHYPEILEQYNNDELNQLQLKNGQVGQIKTKGWLNTLWNNVENWFGNTTNNLSTWWNTTGRNIVLNDFIGASFGAAAGFRIGGVTFSVAGAVSNGIFSSACTPYSF